MPARSPRRDRPSNWTLACAALVAAGALGCRSVDAGPAPGPPPLPTDDAAIAATVHALYDAFCFDPGQTADWDGMRALFAPGAAFYAPIRPGRTPTGQDGDAFLDGFKVWLDTSPIGESGLHELITHLDIERCGTIAHAFVTFDGVIPTTGAAYSQGVDSIQLVADGDRWLVASFTSQYASPGAPLPPRFVDPSIAAQ